MILYVDDEPRYITSFIEELQFEFYQEQIKFEQNTDKAVDFFYHHSQEIKIVILDIMMPSGKAFKNKPTKEGLYTGLFFYERIRESHTDLPIIIFTNIPEEYIYNDFDNNIDMAKIFNKIKLDIDRKKALFLQKQNFFPYELVKEVNTLI